MDELCQRFPLIVQKIMNHVDNETLINFKEAGRNNATFLEKERFYWTRIIQRYNCLFGKLQDVWAKVIKKTSVEIIKELAVAVHQFPQTMIGYLQYSGRPFTELSSPLDFVLAIEKHWHPLLIGATCGSVNLCSHIIQKVGVKESKLRGNEVTVQVFVSEIMKDVSIFKFLLENAKDINWCWILGEYLMHPSFRNKLHSGQTPFQIAASNRQLDVCSFYMKKCVDKNYVLTHLIMQACRPWGCQMLADQLTLSQPRGADYAHQIILAPPDFQTFRRP